MRSGVGSKIGRCRMRTFFATWMCLASIVPTVEAPPKNAVSQMPITSPGEQDLTEFLLSISSQHDSGVGNEIAEAVEGGNLRFELTGDRRAQIVAFSLERRTLIPKVEDELGCRGVNGVIYVNVVAFTVAYVIDASLMMESIGREFRYYREWSLPSSTSWAEFLPRKLPIPLTSAECEWKFVYDLVVYRSKCQILNGTDTSAPKELARLCAPNNAPVFGRAFLSFLHNMGQFDKNKPYNFPECAGTWAEIAVELDDGNPP